MMLVAILMAAAPVPKALLSKADDANRDYVQCLFATSRAAHSANLSIDQFERKLAASCQAEERATQDASVSIFRFRGDPDPVTKAHRLSREARQGLVEDYRRYFEVEPELQRIAELCRTQPDACRQ